MSKSRRSPPASEGPDLLAMAVDEVRRRLEERLQRGREVAAGNYAGSAALSSATTKWKSATETAIDNLFIGSKTLKRFQSSGLMGIGIIGLSDWEEMQEVRGRHSSRMSALEAMIEALPYMREASLERPAPSPAERARPVTINMQSGNVNLGTIVGDVTSNVRGLTGEDAEKIKSLMAQLATTVVEAELDVETKAEAADAVEVVSEAL